MDRTCVATTQKGTRCTRPGIYAGYCKQHHTKRREQIETELERERHSVREQYGTLRPWEHASKKGRDLFQRFIGGEYLTNDIADLIYDMGVVDLPKVLDALNLDDLLYGEVIAFLRRFDLPVFESASFTVDHDEFEQAHHGYSWYSVSDADEKIERMKQRKAHEVNYDTLRKALEDAYIDDIDLFDNMVEYLTEK